MDESPNITSPVTPQSTRISSTIPPFSPRTPLQRPKFSNKDNDDELLFTISNTSRSSLVVGCNLLVHGINAKLKNSDPVQLMENAIVKIYESNPSLAPLSLKALGHQSWATVSRALLGRVSGYVTGWVSPRHLLPYSTTFSILSQSYPSFSISFTWSFHLLFSWRGLKNQPPRNIVAGFHCLQPAPTIFITWVIILGCWYHGVYTRYSTVILTRDHHTHTRQSTLTPSPTQTLSVWRYTHSRFWFAYVLHSGSVTQLLWVSKQGKIIG